MPPKKDIRKAMVKLMELTIADEQTHGNWTYAAVRPLETPERPWVPGVHRRGDCSKGGQWIAYWAGAPDPFGMDFGPYGNSQTAWSNLQHLDHASELLPGDMITFGRDGQKHLSVVQEAGADPLLWSWGHQGAPNNYRLSQDSRERQFLRMPIAAYVPTPEDKLRAKTGWFAWMQWALGEGDWKGHPKSAKGVRPNVPRPIPVSWWKRRAMFLLRRKRGNRPTTKK